MTWRRFGVLLRALPVSGAFSAAVSEAGEADESGPIDVSKWSLSDQLQGMIVDLLSVANWQRGGKGTAPKGMMQAQRSRGRNPDAPEQSLSQDAIRSTLQALAPGLESQ